jgi:hypothetical protein
VYPAKPVRVIVPSAPGGGYDFVGRLLGDKLGAELGQPFIVENRVGAGTLVGTQAAAASAPDGYTLLVGGLANMAFNLGLHKDPRYDPVADFTAVALVGAFTYALVARKDLAQSTLREVLDFARAHPGKLTIATSGIGTGQHISAVLLKRLANVDLLEIAYKGAQPAYVDLLAGRVDLFFDNTTTARPFIADARVKPIVTSGAARPAVAERAHRLGSGRGGLGPRQLDGALRAGKNTYSRGGAASRGDPEGDGVARHATAVPKRRLARHLDVAGRDCRVRPRRGAEVARCPQAGRDSRAIERATVRRSRT